MRIKSISCEQFAGLKDQKQQFNNGINMVYGRNESGKSTLVNLIFHTLFQNARIDKRKDKDFLDLYFPSADRFGKAGDAIDGRISFETPNGEYKLTKEWDSGRNSRCTLRLPNDTLLRDQDEINKILREELVYSEGVYAEMLFSSQRNASFSLQTLLNAKKNTTTKQEIATVISQAFAESGGVPLSVIEQAIDEEIKTIEGKHWERIQQRPERRSGGGEWKKDRGTILDAYYALDKALEKQRDILKLKDTFEKAMHNCAESKKELQCADDALKKFHEFSQLLSDKKRTERDIENFSQTAEKWQAHLRDWQDQKHTLEQAEKLQKESENRSLLDTYESAKEIFDRLTQYENSETAHRLCPSQEEICTVKKAFQEKIRLENELRGMNLNILTKMSGNHTVEVRSLLTGQRIDITDNSTPVSEAVILTVPDVMELQLIPCNIDIDVHQTNIRNKEKILQEIFGKYGVESVQELEDIAQKIVLTNTKIEELRKQLENLTSPFSFDGLKTSVTAIPSTVRSKEEIERDSRKICRNNQLSLYIAQIQGKIEKYEEDYGSIPELEEKLNAKKQELETEKGKLSAITGIPEEYLGISDPERYCRRLEDEVKKKQQQYSDDALPKKIEAEKNYNDVVSSDTDLEKNIEEAKRKFEEQKELLDHWINIRRIFGICKDEMNSTPMSELAESFNRYLKIISEEKVSTEFPEMDRLKMTIYSSDRPLDFEKLSEGTKETVSLAFRLAVLDHLFPDGGGVIILDDPLVDMDAERTLQSVALLEECARRHQIIFLSCKKEYLGLFKNATVIHL